MKMSETCEEKEAMVMDGSVIYGCGVEFLHNEGWMIDLYMY